MGTVHPVVFSEQAVRQYRRLRKADRAFVKEGIRRHLAAADPAQSARNKFRLRRVSLVADYELRLGKWRVFYRLGEDRVEVTLIGEKKDNLLLVGGEEFTL
jgi:mRNA-degrading endonuclease RelE of RelBE toxin-antitoxin system